MSEPKGIKKPWDATVSLNDATPVVVKTLSIATSTIFVTRLVLSIVTHANSKTFTARDSTPASFAAHTDLTAAAGVPSTVEWDFGKNGIKLATGKNFEVLSEAAGIVGKVFAEGYEVYQP